MRYIIRVHWHRGHPHPLSVSCYARSFRLWGLPHHLNVRCSCSYGCSSHFFSVRYSFDHSSLQRELIDICCYLRGVNASVACLVFFSIDSSLTVVVNVRALSGPFSPCCCLILFCFTYQCSDSDRMFGFMFYAP